jgi:hypothetical protein
MTQLRSKTAAGPGQWYHLAAVYRNKVWLTIWPVLLGSGLLGAMLAALLALPVADVRAQGPDRADVVVRLGDKGVKVADIEFSGPISGLEALRMTGLDFVESGGTVCSIEGIGCPAEDCFCACPPPYTDCKYWNYLTWNGTAWESHPVGAGTSVIGDGAVEGWAWGEFGILPPSPPPSSQAQVVVRFNSDTHSNTAHRIVNFSDPISGLEALRLTGLDFVESAGTVCSIEGVGCPAEDCFCACPPPYTDCKYWSYNFWDGNQWQAYSTGAVDSIVSDGDVEGWAWGSGVPPITQPAAGAAAEKALAWLNRQQVISDGGYSNLGDSIEVLMAVAANQLNPTDWTWYDSPSLINYVLSSDTAAFVNNDPAAFGKLAVALSAAEACWPGDTNMLPATTGVPGEYSLLSGPQSWAMLGKVALSQTIPAAAIQVLKNQINDDGGWVWLSGTTSDADGTAMAIQALIAAGEPVTTAEVISGLAFLKSLQTNDGGFANLSTDLAGNSNSTAYAVQALAATRQDPTSTEWTVSGNNPISFLSGLQRENGQIPWRASLDGDVERATRQSVLAFLNTKFPIKETDPQVCSAAITIEGQVSTDFAGVGQTVTYDYLVTNTGNVKVDLIAIDKKLGSITLADETLAAGRRTSGEIAYLVTATDTTSSLLTNFVTVTATPPISEVVSYSEVLTVVMAVPAQIRHLAPFAADVASLGDLSAQSSGTVVVIKNGLQSEQFDDLKFGGTTGLFDLAQINSTVLVTPTIIPALKAAYPITPTGGTTLTVVLVGDNVNVDAPLEALVLTGTTISPSPGHGLLRITHLASIGANRDATAMDLNLQNSGGAVLPFPQNGVKYKDSFGYIQIASDVYTLTATPNSNGDPISLVFEIKSGAVGDIFLAGNDTNQALAVYSARVKNLSDASNVYVPIIIKDF